MIPWRFASVRSPYIFTGYARGERIHTKYVCFTEYDVTIPNKEVAFVKEEITNTFGEFLAANPCHLLWLLHAHQLNEGRRNVRQTAAFAQLI